MKEKIQIFFIFLVRFISRALFIFPINKRKICFIAFGGRALTCNPKYIYNSIFNKFKNKYEYIWLIKDKRNNVETNDNTKIIKYISIKSFYHLATSKYIITNYSMIIRPPIRKKQIYVNTWHGGGAYKRVGVVKNTIDKKRTALTFKILAKETDYLISSCQIQTGAHQETMMISSSNILNIGFPRNDIFFKDYSHLKSKIYEKYKIPNNVKLLLYAPTYRGVAGNLSENTSLDIDTVLCYLEKKFNSKFLCLYRGHYYIHNKKITQTIDVSDYSDMQELLCAADILITDYSSSIWDFSYTKKPCFLYTPDLEDYKNERDFYTDISKWGFSISKNTNQLIENIEKFNQNEYNMKIDEAHKYFGSFEEGNASERFIKTIFKLNN